jgi:hypothetical protein
MVGDNITIMVCREEEKERIEGPIGSHAGDLKIIENIEK